MFITLEGPDGSGKSSLTRRLETHLMALGVPVVATREPGGTVAGAKIRHMLLTPDLELSSEAELLLFLADRAQHVHEVILPALRAGAVVLCDRYADSTWAYQGHGRGRLEQMRRVRTEMLCPTMPDLTLILDVDPATAAHRIARRAGETNRLDKEALAFHHRVREGFHAIAKAYPERCRVLDAGRPERVVLAEALELVTAALEAHKRDEGAGLWSPAPSSGVFDAT